MIKSRADVNHKKKDGLTALMWQLTKLERKTRVVNKTGADVNQRKNGWTALMRAAQKGTRKKAQSY
ncbi:MAG: hypothetical protein ISN64_02350 [Rickettsia sp.]|nr:hypothetical protein [Rickettsia sp.]